MREQQEAEIAGLNKTIESKEAQIAKLIEDLQYKNQTIARLNDDLKVKDTTITRLYDRLVPSGQQESISELADKPEINKLRKKLDNAQKRLTRCAGLAKENEILRTEIRGMCIVNEVSRDTLATLKTQLESGVPLARCSWCSQTTMTNAHQLGCVSCGCTVCVDCIVAQVNTKFYQCHVHKKEVFGHIRFALLPPLK